ncbi:MAG: amidohydrolase family protein [Acidobacteria bacterium]|nr:amidohydrolase family protein [Acidobacteriota bacterium]
MRTGKNLRVEFTFALALGALVAAPLAAQKAPAVIAIRGAKIHTLAGAPIENGTVLLRGERIAAVGADVEIPVGAQVIDATGLEVYPGLFDSISRLGLTEIGAVSATVDTNELGSYNPQLLAATGVHPASEHIPVARANGITHAVSAPGSGGGGFFGGFSGPVIPGQASLIHLTGWTIEEMLIRPSVGMILNWPSIQTRTFDFSTFEFREKPFTEAKKEYEERVGELEDWLEAAKHYAQAEAKGSKDRFERDLKLEALAKVLRGELPLLVMANSARDIKNAIEFVEKHKLKMILAGGAEAWKVKDLLKQENIPVILRPTQALPGEEDEAYDKPFTNAGELDAAGVKIAFATFDSADSRTLPYEAANAVPYGLPRDEALKGITRYPAEILGVGNQLGTIEAGKVANLIVTDGDPLEITTQVRHLFIKGQPTSTDNRHQQLYEKYRARP